MGPARHVWVYDAYAKKWNKGTIAKGMTKVVLYNGTTVIGNTMPQKYNGRQFHHKRVEIMPTKVKRADRCFIPNPIVTAVYYTKPGMYGDYGHMLRDLRYKDWLLLYNENVEQYRNKNDLSGGGGNAIARPYRIIGKALGIPTGSLNTGGFRSLDEMVCGKTAREWIDESIESIIYLLLSKPNIIVLSYCTNNPALTMNEDDRYLIGMGIFRK